jgi:ribosome-binding ATPase YchF (GTP1/OBG family)
MVCVLNVGEHNLNTGETENLCSTIRSRYPLVSVLVLCGKIEMEIAQLSTDDKNLFLDDLGLDEPASNKLIHACYSILGFISFFTYAGDEVKAWTIKKGTNAQKAAGKVHSDIERGFIRAEAISFENFISSGSIHAAREKGLLRLEGKTYEVKDGDIINFRFNI